MPERAEPKVSFDVGANDVAMTRRVTIHDGVLRVRRCRSPHRQFAVVEANSNPKSVQPNVDKLATAEPF
jgi:hypothetical protein